MAIPINMGTTEDPHYSNLNAPTTPLGADETFTGDWEDVQNYDDVIVSVATDAPGEYYIQFSNESENVDSSLTRYYRPNQFNVPHRFTIARRWFRLVYVNGATPQTYLRVQTSFGHGRHALNVPVDGAVAPDYDATVVRPTNYVYEVAQGLRQGHGTFNKFGFNPSIENGVPETIWAVGGTFVPLTTASTLTIVSSDTNDDGDPAGTGARLLQIVGIDANRKVQTETVTMNGTTPVVTTSTWLGINRAAVALAGSTQNNVGNITITATTGGSNQAYVPAGQGVTQQCVYFNELQSKAMLDWLVLNVRKLSGGTAPRVTIDGWVYSPVSNGKYLIFRHNIDTNVENTVELKPSQPFVLNAGDVLWFDGSTNTNGTTFSMRFSLIDVQDANYDGDI